MYALKLVLDQVITQYQQTEESLIVTEETNLEKFNKVMTGISYHLLQSVGIILASI